MPDGCAACGEPFTGAHMEAQGKKYHQKCFICSHCDKAIAGSYLVVENKIYDPECWDKIRPRTYCCGCEAEIPAGQQYIEAMEKIWHHGCFTCVLCDKAFDEYKYWTYAPGLPESGLPEQPIHEPCRPKAEAGEELTRMPPSWKEWFEKQKAKKDAADKEAADKEAADKAAKEAEDAKKEEPAPAPEPPKENYPPCFACDGPIKESSMRIYANNKYHFECFVCATCKKELEGNGPFPILEKNLYHHDCYPWKTCNKCTKRIEGPVLSAMDKHFHKECFVCAKCEKPFTGGFTMDGNGAPIHTECA